MGRIAVTGASSFLGGLVLRRLVEDRGARNVVAIDLGPAPAIRGVRQIALDLTEPGADQRLGEALRREDVEAMVHAAFFTNPRRDSAHAHEVESIGTLHLLGAAAAAGVRHVVHRSFTLLYGARGQNPSLLREEHPLSAGGSFWVRDKVEAEQNALAYPRRFPGLRVTVLRLAPLLGDGVDNFYTRLLARRVVPVLLGYDPLVQLLHPEDAADAVLAALREAPAGAVNVVPRDAVSLKTALHLADRLTVPVPHPLAYAAADAFWSAGLAEAPGSFLDYARFPCVADGDRARRDMGFVARYRSKEALADFFGRPGHALPAPVAIA